VLYALYKQAKYALQICIIKNSKKCPVKIIKKLLKFINDIKNNPFIKWNPPKKFFI